MLLFDQPAKNDLRTYDNIRKSANGQEDEFTTGCLLDYPYLREHYKMIAIYLNKQQVLDAAPKAMQQINFTGNLDRDANTITFFINEEANEPILDFSQGTVRVF